MLFIFFTRQRGFGWAARTKTAPNDTSGTCFLKYKCFLCYYYYYHYYDTLRRPALFPFLFTAQGSRRVSGLRFLFVFFLRARDAFSVPLSSCYFFLSPPFVLFCLLFFLLRGGSRRVLSGPFFIVFNCFLHGHGVASTH